MLGKLIFILILFFFLCKLIKNFYSPYLFIGWCFGGLVAFEMAQLLRSQNQKTAFLLKIKHPKYRITKYVQ
ncbi:thioesterase domain-containing protein [Nostoc sp.]|uniref:thioesterase domain-containing protein n=1 Tax=Nostoc sp. TaxID=1180 RepID=UPI003FA55A47